MGFGRLRLAYAQALGNPARKAVLTALAYRACDDCGIAWPGVQWISTTSEVSRRRVQECLEELTTSGHLSVRKYSKGGRGVATEYIVLPSLGQLSTAPCGPCAERMRNGAERARLGVDTVQSVHGKDRQTVHPASKNRAQAAHHQSEKHNQSGSPSAPRSETALPGRSTSDEPRGVPSSVKDALRGLGIFGPPEDTSEAR